jgi:hypothetical protein
MFKTETFKKCQFLFKFKQGENFNHPGEIELCPLPSFGATG